MIKVCKKNDLKLTYHLPQEVQDKAAGIIENLDSIYGINRHTESDGGYIAILTNTSDLEVLAEYLDMDLETDAIPEYVETLPTSLGQTYSNTLILCNNDFAITILMPLEITPNCLKEYIIEWKH